MENWEKQDWTGIDNEMDVFYTMENAVKANHRKDFVVDQLERIYGKNWRNTCRKILDGIGLPLVTPEIKEAFEKYAN